MTLLSIKDRQEECCCSLIYKVSVSIYCILRYSIYK